MTQTPWLMFLGLLAIPFAGCSRMPDSSAARAAYAAHLSTIDDVATKVHAALRALPQVEVVRCEDAADVARAHDPRRDAEFAACSTRRAQWIERKNASWNAFRTSLPAETLFAHHDVVGLSVSVATRGDSSRYAVAIGATMASVVGVPAAHGFAPEGDERGRRVGYHLYQTAISFRRGGGTEVRAGDGEQRPGIEISWSITDGEATATITLVVLIDDETTDDWRRAQRELLSREP